MNHSGIISTDDMESFIAESFGYISGSMFCAALIPQIIRTIRTQRARDMSYIHHYMCMTAVSLNIAYSSYFDLRPILIPAIVNLILFMTLHVFKCHYDRNTST